MKKTSTIHLNPGRYSLIQLNLSVLFLSLVPLFAKLVNLGAVSIIAWRAALGAAALLIFLVLRRDSWRLERGRDYVVVAILGVVMAIHWSTFFHGIQISTVAVAMVAMFTWPVMVVLIEPWVMGVRHRLRDLLLALLALVGVALVVPNFSLDGSAMQGAAWGLLAALLYAFRNVYHRHYLARYPGSRVMAYQLVVAALCLLPFASAPDMGDWHNWELLLLLAVVFTALPHTLFVASMRRLPAKTAGMISCLQPAYGIAAAALILGETTTWRTWLGAALVMGVALTESVGTPRSVARKVE